MLAGGQYAFDGIERVFPGWIILEQDVVAPVHFMRVEVRGAE
jgi:hypothetical protein